MKGRAVDTGEKKPDPETGDRAKESNGWIGVDSDEAEHFVQVYLPESYHLTTDFRHRSFHAVSCLGREPVYCHYENPENPDSLMLISREQVEGNIENGYDLHVWVKDIHPTCEEEPLGLILVQFEARVKRSRGKCRRFFPLSRKRGFLLD